MLTIILLYLKSWINNEYKSLDFRFYDNQIYVPRYASNINSKYITKFLIKECKIYNFKLMSLSYYYPNNYMNQIIK